MVKPGIIQINTETPIRRYSNHHREIYFFRLNNGR